MISSQSNYTEKVYFTHEEYANDTELSKEY